MTADQMAMYVDGAWGAAETGEPFDAVNPGTGEVFARVARGEQSAAESVGDATREVESIFEKWRAQGLVGG